MYINAISILTISLFIIVVAYNMQTLIFLSIHLLLFSDGGENNDEFYFQQCDNYKIISYFQVRVQL